MWLADVLRGAGLHVVETPGWRERTSPYAGALPWEPVGVLEHHTATTASYERPAPTVDLCVRGRPDLAGPLCHGVIGYDGVVHLISAGRANHAGQAKASGPCPAGDGNTLYVGFEWDYQGVNQGPSPEQYAAAVRATRAVLDHLGLSAEHARGHKETSVTGKIDPGRVDMTLFRAAVASGEQELDMATTNELFDLVRRYSGGDSAFGYTIPRSPDRVRTFAAAIPPKFGRVTGTDGELFVSLVAGENVEVREVYACEDWQADGKPGRKYGLQGPYTLVANDRQSWPIPAAATQVCVVYRSDCDLSLSVEIDAKWK
ncbi:N-acetylmuramoyl-L-alanine amidase [Saccharopolyspora taberi]|uniref:peptidoglycan recognition protein family protein n=1 Tax=Saccharopolyspora taberi TaxID=60895 RepID=UPI0031D81900